MNPLQESSIGILKLQCLRSIVILLIGTSYCVALADDIPANIATPVGVVMPDSTAAVELLQRASDKQAESQWKPAAELYQQILQKYADQLIQVPQEGTELTRYLSAARIVRDRLASAPAEEVTAFNILFAGVAASALHQAMLNDSDGMAAVYGRYPCTPAAGEAGLEILDQAIDQGDFSKAIAVGNSLLKSGHSLSADLRAKVLCRIALASHWAEDDDASEVAASGLRQIQPSPVGRLGGQDGVLTELVDAALKLQPPAAKLAPAVMATDPLFKVKFAPKREAPKPKQQSSGFSGTEQRSPEPPTVFAAVNDTEAFVQDSRSVYAFDAGTGKPLAGWPGGGKYTLDLPGRAHQLALRVAVTPDSVVALIGQPDRGRVRSYEPLFLPSSQDTTRLTCLERDTGSERWSHASADFPESAGVIRTLNFVGTPIASEVRNSVFVLLRRNQSDNFDECYLASLSLESGNFQWSTYIGGCTTGVGERTNYGTVQPVLEVSGDTAYVMTNRGAVVAVDTMTGALKWGDVYERNTAVGPSETSQPYDRLIEAPSQPWRQNPLVVQQGWVYAMPADSGSFFVLDAQTGSEESHLLRKDLSNASILVGIQNRRACLTNDHDLFIVDFKPAVAGSTYSLTWREVGFTSELYNSVSGRGIWQNDSIYIPTDHRIDIFSASRRRIVSTFPPHELFDHKNGVGNLTVAGEHLLFARPTGVTVLGTLNVEKSSQ